MVSDSPAILFDSFRRPTMSLWQTIDIEANRAHHLRVGPWSLWFEKTANEWRLATRLDEDNNVLEPPEPADKPDDLDWRRWMCAQPPRPLRLAPAMPDRAIVVRPGAPMGIMPGLEALFYVSIPVWVNLTLEGPRGALLVEEPTVVLSSTWFGEMSSGELAYSLKTIARRSIGVEQITPNRAICPVIMRNAAKTPLQFRRFCLQTQYLNIYEGPWHLWTNQATVTFHGEESPSRTEYARRPPSGHGVGDILTQARRKPPKGIWKQTFDNTKLLNMIGL